MFEQGKIAWCLSQILRNVTFKSCEFFFLWWMQHICSVQREESVCDSTRGVRQCKSECSKHGFGSTLEYRSVGILVVKIYYISAFLVDRLTYLLMLLLEQFAGILTFFISSCQLMKRIFTQIPVWLRKKLFTSVASNVRLLCSFFNHYASINLFENAFSGIRFSLHVQSLHSSHWRFKLAKKWWNFQVRSIIMVAF